MRDSETRLADIQWVLVNGLGLSAGFVLYFIISGASNILIGIVGIFGQAFSLRTDVGIDAIGTAFYLERFLVLYWSVRSPPGQLPGSRLKV